MKDNPDMNHQSSGASRRNVILGAGAAAAVAGMGLALWRLEPKAVADASHHPVWSEQFETPSGEGLRMSAFRGKPLLLNFWATWCAPCKEELPSLQALHDAVDPPVVIGINVKEPEGRVRTFLNHAQLNLPVVLDGRGELARQWGVRIYPTTVVLGPDSRARWRVVGDLDWNGPLARGWLASVKPTP